MGDSEQKFLEKISKTQMNSSKKVSEVIAVFGKAQKLKAESLKKTEEMMNDAANDLEKLERDIAREEDLSGASKNRLNEQIAAARSQVRKKYNELTARIADRVQ